MADATVGRRSSVRFRITALAAVVVLVVLAVTSVALLFVVRANLTNAVDTELLRRTQDTKAVLADGDADFVAAVGDDDESFVQVVAGSRVAVATPNVFALAPVASAGTEGSTLFRTIDIDELDDTSFRIASSAITFEGQPGTLHVGRSLEDVEETTAVLAASLAIGAPLVAALLAALVWNLVGRTLRDVESIRSEVAAIDGNELERRVPVPETDDEVGALATTMNEMLDRIEASNDTLRQFVADASHELRSPLTRLRTQLEVEGADIDVEEMHGEVVGMQHLVEDLLYLARLDAEGGLPTRSRIDLDHLVSAELSALVESPGMAAEAELEPVMVTGDERGLRRAVRNVLENAVRFATARVAVTLAATGGNAVLTVADDGPGIPPEAATSVFDRFTQLDAARSATGSGLGLAIANDIIERHAGSIEIADPILDGATVVITIPATDDTD